MTVVAGLQGGVRTLVDDDHGTGLAATLLPIGHPLAGRLSGAGDVDAFRIDLAGAARVEVRTSGPTDTRGRLLDADGLLRAEDGDSGPGGHNFKIAVALEPGVHYVEVRGAAGHYSVVAVLADSVDHGDTAAASTALAFPDEWARGDRAQDILLGASGRIWPTVSDVDVFRLDVPFEDSVFVRSSGNKSLRASLVDSSLSDVVRSEIRTDRHGNIRTGEVLDAGTYYVVVGGDEVGAYRLLAQRFLGPRPYSSCTEPSLATPRDGGNSPESSTLLVLGGSPAAGDIADDADVDMFRLDVHGRAQVEVRASGGTPTRGELYDADGALVASDEGGGPGGRSFRIERELATGVYYVAVRGASGARGGYAVSARAGAAFDHPDVPRNATLLRLHDVLDLARATPDML
ncbi:MAG: hypothetical protein OXQ28_02865, partial [Acidobacteriota bacterium]|nr:hypothetical protein [Acidobacteriota bacterium]